MSRDLPAPAAESFREWWRRTRGPAPVGTRSTPPATIDHFAPYVGANVESVGDGRADILHRIRAAVGPAAASDVPRNYRTQDERTPDEIVTLFAERVAEYRATVHRVNAADVAATVQRIGEEAGARRLGIPGDLPDEWRPAGSLELVQDDELSIEQLDALDGALTGCAVAIAETGTFVLDGGVGQGRRALTLVPDLHVCVVREDRVVGLVPQAVGELEDAVRAGRALTFVSGPSATSDIELDRVEGVHGPRVLHVVIVA
jgi:L-lactate dehydrogenase complex protein LldG